MMFSSYENDEIDLHLE